MALGCPSCQFWRGRSTDMPSDQARCSRCQAGDCNSCRTHAAHNWQAYRIRTGQRLGRSSSCAAAVSRRGQRRCLCKDKWRLSVTGTPSVKGCLFLCSRRSGHHALATGATIRDATRCTKHQLSAPSFANWPLAIQQVVTGKLPCLPNATRCEEHLYRMQRPHARPPAYCTPFSPILCATPGANSKLEPAQRHNGDT